MPETASAPLVTYDVTEAQIAQTKARYAALSADTPKGYEEVRLAIAEVRDTRVAVEKRRVELKADALAYGRLVDSEARRFTNLLLEIEEPLKAKKAAIDDEKARVKAEREAAERAALEAEIAARRAQEEAELRAKREAEEKALAEERAALAAERERLAAEQARLDAERRAEEERQKAERERAEKIRRDAELEAMAPDAEKVRAYAKALRVVAPPVVEAAELARLVRDTDVEVLRAVTRLESAVAALLPLPAPGEGGAA